VSLPKLLLSCIPNQFSLSQYF